MKFTEINQTFYIILLLTVVVVVVVIVLVAIMVWWHPCTIVHYLWLDSQFRFHYVELPRRLLISLTWNTTYASCKERVVCTPAVRWFVVVREMHTIIATISLLTEADPRQSAIHHSHTPIRCCEFKLCHPMWWLGHRVSPPTHPRYEHRCRLPAPSMAPT